MPSISASRKAVLFTFAFLFALFGCESSDLDLNDFATADPVEHQVADDGLIAGGMSVPTESECSAALRDVGVSFKFEDHAAIPRPVRITTAGPGVLLKYGENSPAGSLLTSCAVAAALGAAVAEANAAGLNVTAVIHLGSFAHRNVAGTQILSDHAQALAIDIAGFATPKQTLTVKANWSSPAMSLFRAAVGTQFEAVLDPKTNAAHADHLHAARPLAAALAYGGCTLTVTQPTAGASLAIGSATQVCWVAKGQCKPAVLVHLYRNAEHLWTLAANTPTAGGCIPFEPLPAMPIGGGYLVGLAEVGGDAAAFSGAFAVVTAPSVAGVAEPIDHDGDGVLPPVDCNDNDAATFPSATENCDGKDNNCNNTIDEGCPVAGPTKPAVIDSDGDGVAATKDCNDADPATYPGATEVCDAKDNDCDGITDEGCNQPTPPAQRLDATKQLVVTVKFAKTFEKLVFNYCLQPNIASPLDCQAWVEPGVTQQSASLISFATKASKGGLRFNVTKSDGGYTAGWLCQGFDSPMLTGEITATYGGKDVSSAVVPIALWGGCSAWLPLVE